MVYLLYWYLEWFGLIGGGVYFDCFQMWQQCCVGILWYVFVMCGDVVVFEVGNWDCGEILNVDVGGKFVVFGDDLIEFGLIVIDQIYFVYGQYDMVDVDQLYQIVVVVCLGQYVFVCVDQDYCQIGG